MPTNSIPTEDEINRRAMRGLMKATNKTTAAVLGNSVPEAPVEFGDLRGNAHATDAERSGWQVRGSVVYEDEYARAQHERMDYNHPRGGGPKYLENPLRAYGQKHLRNGEEALQDEFRHP